MLLKVIYLLFFTLIRCRTNELKQILDTFVLIFIFFFWLVFISNVSTADPSITVLFAGYIGRGLNCWCHQREGVAKNILCLEHFHFSSQRHAFFFFAYNISKVSRGPPRNQRFIPRYNAEKFERWFSIQNNCRSTTSTDENLYPSVIFQSTLKVHLSKHFVFFGCVGVRVIPGSKVKAWFCRFCFCQAPFLF